MEITRLAHSETRLFSCLVRCSCSSDTDLKSYFECSLDVLGEEITLALSEKIMKGERSSRYLEKNFALMKKH